jgi:hypothetical protein
LDDSLFEYDFVCKAKKKPEKPEKPGSPEARAANFSEIREFTFWALGPTF